MNDLQDFLVQEVTEVLMDRQDLQDLMEDLVNQDLKGYLESKVHSQPKAVKGFLLKKKNYLLRRIKINVLFLGHCRNRSYQ